ncbi:stress-activated map kinase interacting protein 1-domain-containing protein, partial [Piptocephalis cylindrospora]
MYSPPLHDSGVFDDGVEWDVQEVDDLTHASESSRNRHPGQVLIARLDGSQSHAGSDRTGGETDDENGFGDGGTRQYQQSLFAKRKPLPPTLQVTTASRPGRSDSLDSLQAEDDILEEAREVQRRVSEIQGLDEGEGGEGGEAGGNRSNASPRMAEEERGRSRIKAPPFPSIITSMEDLRAAASEDGRDQEEAQERIKHVPQIHFMPAAQRDLPPGTPPPQTGAHTESLPAPPISPLLSAPRVQRKRNVYILTAAINKRKSVLSNPLAAEFGIVSGKGDPNALELRMFFPHSEEPDLPMSVLVKGDAIVEDIIGFAMYMYVDEKRQPLLDLESYGVVCWNLRIVEDDGEVDDDFPALERSRQIRTFGSLEFAIERASPAQKKMNEMGYKSRLAVKEANGLLKPSLPIPGNRSSALSAGLARPGRDGAEGEEGAGTSSALSPASAAHHGE